MRENSRDSRKDHIQRQHQVWSASREMTLTFTPCHRVVQTRWIRESGADSVQTRCRLERRIRRPPARSMPLTISAYVSLLLHLASSSNVRT